MMEFKRILAGKPFLILLAALLVFNLWFFVYQNSRSDADFRYFGDLYHATLEELEGLTPEEGIKKCEEYDQNAAQKMIEGTWENTAENIFKLQIMKQLREQFSHIDGYGEYVTGIQESAERLQSVSLFSKPGSFAYENTVKTAEDFSALLGISVTMGSDLAVSEVFSDSWTDIILLLPVFLVCALFVSERRTGLYQLIYASPAGRKKLAAKRVFILLIASFASVLLLCGSKILLCGYLYHGLDEWGRALQSIPIFYNVPIPITIGEFWILHLIFKTFSLFFCGLVIWLVLSAISNLPLAICVLGLVMGAEFAFTAIPSSSVFAILRYANLMSYINYLPVFKRYLNIPFFGTIISGNELIFLLLPILCLLFISLNIIVAEWKHPISKKSRLPSFTEKLRSTIDGIFCGGGLFLRELKKLLIYRKGIFVILILGIWLMQAGVPMKHESTPFDMYLQYYQTKYAGPITADTASELAKELSTASEPERATALRQLILLTEIATEGSWILPTEPYEALFTPQKYHYETALCALLFLVILTAPILSQERQAEMEALLAGTPRGRGGLMRRKQAVIILCTFAVWLLVYGGEVLRMIDFYGDLSCLGAPVSSLTELSVSEYGMSIGGLLALLYFLRFAVLLCASEICFCLSGFCRKNSSALLLCCGALLVPSALAAIGSYVGKSVSLLMPLAAVDILPGIYPYIFIAVLLLGAILFSNLRAKRL